MPWGENSSVDKLCVHASDSLWSGIFKGKIGNSLIENRDIMVANLKALPEFEHEVEQSQLQDTNSSCKYLSYGTEEMTHLCMLVLYTNTVEKKAIV